MSATLAYGLTRMHARIAERPTNEARARLLSIADFGHFLQAAARSGFAAWLTRLGPGSSSHQVELALRLSYRELLGEVARWLPRRWQSGIDWLKLAPELPALNRLLRGEPAPAWMRQDPWLAALLDEHGLLDRDRLSHAWPALGNVEADRLGRHWMACATVELPDLGGRRAGEVEALLRGQIEPAAGPGDSLELELAFRRRPEATLRILAFAALAQRDLEFLRGQLTRRALSAPGGA